MSEPDQTTHFGFRDVPLEDKQGLVNSVFHSVASRYDLMNDLMSAGLHRVWKDIMVNTLNPPKGDAAVRAARCRRRHRRYRFPRGAGGRRRLPRHRLRHQSGHAARRTGARRCAPSRRSRLVCRRQCRGAGVRRSRFDGYTIAFGIRNVPRIDRALSEAYRVLKPGSRFLCLEFSTVDVPGLDRAL